MSTGPQEEGQVPGPLPESSERMGSQPHTGTLPGLKPHWGVTQVNLLQTKDLREVNTHCGQRRQEQPLRRPQVIFMRVDKVQARYYCWKGLAIFYQELTLEKTLGEPLNHVT